MYPLWYMEPMGCRHDSVSRVGMTEYQCDRCNERFLLMRRSVLGRFSKNIRNYFEPKKERAAAVPT